MKPDDYVEWVEQARRGDLDAFSRLVGAYQDLAVGAAFGWLGDAELARDATQEAFLDVYVHIGELREPRAFPAWLRRIVRKRCDRITRRRRLPTDSLDEGTSAPGEALDHGMQRQAEASELRLAVAALPAPERLVVALSYFAELSGEQTAAFLELPLSTVKKRLRSARSRLRAHGVSLMQQSLEHLRPSSSKAFSEVVEYFLAIRAGDHARVRYLLERSPALVDAVQEWDGELVTDGVLPFASRATALITAIERDDLTLMQILLDAGASADGNCACATGETPVWAATLLNRTRLLRLLLERGADPDRAVASGTRALHVAAMRGHAAAAELLLAFGADPLAADRRGCSAAQWAQRNGHNALAARLGADAVQTARVVHRGHDPSSAGSVLFTGIKALDLFCPLSRGGLVRVPFMAGVGMVVLLGELCERITRRPSGRALWTGFAQRPFDVTDWRAEMSELGILDRVAQRMADVDADPDARREAFRRGLDLGRQQRAAGHDVLLIVLSERGFEGEVDAALPELVDGGGPGSLTTVVITPFPERADATWSAPLAPYDAQLRLDRQRARRGLFPAVHPELSWSRALSADRVGAHHVRVAQRARQLLNVFVAADPEFAAVPRPAITDPHFPGLAPSPGMNDADRAVTLLGYLSQPFYVAEPFTGVAGCVIEQPRLLAEVEAILDGPGADAAART